MHLWFCALLRPHDGPDIPLGTLAIIKTRTTSLRPTKKGSFAAKTKNVHGSFTHGRFHGWFTVPPAFRKIFYSCGGCSAVSFTMAPQVWGPQVAKGSPLSRTMTRAVFFFSAGLRYFVAEPQDWAAHRISVPELDCNGSGPFYSQDGTFLGSFAKFMKSSGFLRVHSASEVFKGSTCFPKQHDFTIGKAGVLVQGKWEAPNHQSKPQFSRKVEHRSMFETAVLCDFSWLDRCQMFEPSVA